MNRLMIVDDALIMRMRIREVATLAGWTVVAEAANGNEAVRLFNELQPDLVTLDVEMPDINGIDVLRELKRRRIRTNVVMISRLTAAGAQVTTDAMIEGAFDFILKPSGSSPSENKNTLRIALLEKIAALADARSGLASDVLGSPPPPRQTAPVVKPEAIVIACSTGGPDALSQVIPDLSATLPVPVFIIQHMPPRSPRDSTMPANFTSSKLKTALSKNPVTRSSPAEASICCWNDATPNRSDSH